MSDKTPAEQKYAIALYFGRGNAPEPDPSEAKDWEPSYPNQWSWASNPAKREPIEPEHGTPILPA